jgi:hypothetical protein
MSTRDSVELCMKDSDGESESGAKVSMTDEIVKRRGSGQRYYVLELNIWGGVP